MVEVTDGGGEDEEGESEDEEGVGRGLEFQTKCYKQNGERSGASRPPHQHALVL